MCVKHINPEFDILQNSHRINREKVTTQPSSPGTAHLDTMSSKKSLEWYLSFLLLLYFAFEFWLQIFTLGGKSQSKNFYFARLVISLFTSFLFKITLSPVPI